MKKVIAVAGLVLVLAFTALTACAEQSYTVTFQSNGGTEIATQLVEAGGVASEPKEPERDGFEFSGWYTQEELGEEYLYDFTEPVTENITLYAGWTSDPVATFYWNYAGAPEFYSKVIFKDGGRIVAPADPDRGDGYSFDGWYADEDCTVMFDPTANYSDSRSFYAKWTKQPVATYTFEAEGCDLTGLSSFGYSVNVNETDMIQPRKEISASVTNSLSNGYFVGYFQTTDEDGITLKFPIDADKASTGNKMSLRLGTEYGTITLDPDVLQVKVNGTALDYEAITVVGENLTSVTQYKGYTVPFADYTLSAEFDLKAGENLIELTMMPNELGFKDEPMLSSVGPGVDCIKVRSESALTWESMWEDNKLSAGLE